MLQAAWDHTQAVRSETGIVIEIRLTVVGLTVMVGNDAFSRTATVSWRELAHSEDLRRLLCAKISEVAKRSKLKSAPAGQEPHEADRE